MTTLPGNPGKPGKIAILKSLPGKPGNTYVFSGPNLENLEINFCLVLEKVPHTYKMLEKFSKIKENFSDSNFSSLSFMD